MNHTRFVEFLPDSPSSQGRLSKNAAPNITKQRNQQSPWLLIVIILMTSFNKSHLIMSSVAMAALTKNDTASPIFTDQEAQTPWRRIAVAHLRQPSDGW